MKAKFKKLFSFVLSLVVIVTAFPSMSDVLAAVENKVRVIIKNDTFSVDDGAAWEGTLIDKWVDIDSSSTMISAIGNAITSEGYTVNGIETNYIDMVAGLSAYDGGWMSGWMGTLNDWFTNESFGAYTVANGKLQPGDEICMMYTCDYGEDIGGSWSNTSTKLKDLTFSAGSLTTAFSKDVTSYTLVLPDDVNSVVVTPTAENKNYMVKIYKNTYTYNVPGSEYKRTAAIDVVSGDKIIVGVGNNAWPTMNSEASETKYEITVKKASDMVEKPAFENIVFLSSAVSNWTTTSYDKNTYAYDLQIKTYSTSTLTFTANTKYDAEKYSAKMFYTDINNNDVVSDINNAKISSAYNMPFGNTDLYVVIGEKAVMSSVSYDDVKNAEVDNKKVSIYKFNVNRPTDTSNGLASSGIVLSVNDRSLSAKKYLGYAEGTFFKANDDFELLSTTDKNGNVKYQTGVVNGTYSYKTFIIDSADKVALTVKGKTAYVHSRVKVEGGEYEEVAYNTMSKYYNFNGADSLTFYVQTVSDTEYKANGFANAEQTGNVYKVLVEKLNLDANDGVITSVNVLSNTSADLYPEYSETARDFTVIIGANDEYPNVEFTTSEGAEVKLASTVLTPNADGKYVITLKASAQKITVTGTQGLVNEYTFKSSKKVANGADKVVDYLCIGSQYTNTAAYGLAAETILAGTMKSLGNFGGYVTLYFEDAITDDPNNMYGVDFYAYGNAFASGGSAAESGQVWVSEDGENWYALAGSEHYEDTTLKDYTITYTKLPNGKVSWEDNYGNKNDGSSYTGAYPDASKYYLNDLCAGESVTIKGILLPCIDGTVMGDSSTNSFAGATSFGYVDYFANGTVLANVNPYALNATSNGFDLAWAVDEEGNKVEFANGIHYVKIVTASNIWAGAFNEKSTEVSRVVRTNKQENAVGKTEAPESIKVEGAASDTIVALEDNKFEYDVLVDDGDAFKLSVLGANANDNIYINNKRVAAEEVVEIAKTSDDKKVRVIVQNGEKEPLVYVLTLKSNTENATEDIYNETINAMLNGEAPIVSSVGGEWVVIALARAEKISDEFKAKYIENVKEYVTNVGASKLHATKSTDNSRVIMALAALGEDPTDVNGYNLLQPLSDFNYVKKQGLNGPIFALIAFDTAKYDIVEVSEEDGITDVTTRAKLVNYILEKQLADGGFALFGTKGDVDMTAMAVQALAPYYETVASRAVDNTGVDKAAVKTAVDKAVEFLSNAQSTDGGFVSWGSSNAESNAQTIIALSALGIDVRTDARFVKNGNSALAALYSFYAGNGNFKHIIKGTANAMATEQSALALVAYVRMTEEKTSLYNMTDVVKKQPVDDNNDTDNNDTDNNGTDNNDTDNNDVDNNDADNNHADNNDADNNDVDGNNTSDNNNNNVGNTTLGGEDIKNDETPLDNGTTGSDVRTADTTNTMLFTSILAMAAAMVVVFARKKEKIKK